MSKEFYTKLTKEDVEKIVIESSKNREPVENRFFEGCGLEENFSYGDNEPVNGYLIKRVDSFGGEGQGNEIWAVYVIIDEAGHKTHFRVQGYYDSWNGIEWDGRLELVEGYEVTVTKWMRVK